MNTTRTWMALGLALALGSGGAWAQAAGGSGSGGGGVGGGAAAAGSGSVGGTAGNGTEGSTDGVGAGTTAPAGTAAGTDPRGPSGTLTPPPVLGDPASPGSFGPGSRDSQGSPAGQGGAAGGGTSAPGSGVSGVLGPASRSSITVNASSFRALDADGDSRLGPSEIRDPEMREAFSRLDRNSDGQLSEQEYLFFGRDPDRRR